MRVVFLRFFFGGLLELGKLRLRESLPDHLRLNFFIFRECFQKKRMFSRLFKKRKGILLNENRQFFFLMRFTGGPKHNKMSFCLGWKKGLSRLLVQQRKIRVLPSLMHCYPECVLIFLNLFRKRI